MVMGIHLCSLCKASALTTVLMSLVPGHHGLQMNVFIQHQSAFDLFLQDFIFASAVFSRGYHHVEVSCSLPVKACFSGAMTVCSTPSPWSHQLCQHLSHHPGLIASSNIPLTLTYTSGSLPRSISTLLGQKKAPLYLGHLCPCAYVHLPNLVLSFCIFFLVLFNSLWTLCSWESGAFSGNVCGMKTSSQGTGLCISSTGIRASPSLPQQNSQEATCLKGDEANQMHNEFSRHLLSTLGAKSQEKRWNSGCDSS